MTQSSMRKEFGKEVARLGGIYKNLYVVSMDLKNSLGLGEFAKKYPKRFVECGVAENNAAGVAAGLAKTGKRVILASFGCFSPAINWAVIKQSIACNNLPVIVVGSHAGLMSGQLGASHQMLEDVALMRAMPNMEVVAPIDSVETKKVIKAAMHTNKPIYIRLVRPESEEVFDRKDTFAIGKATILKKGNKVTILGYGPVLIQAMKLEDSVEVIDCASIKPLDEDTILESVKKTGKVIVIEDHQHNGGLGEAVASMLLGKGIQAKMIHLAIDDRFGQSAEDYNDLWDEYGIGIKDLKRAIEKLC